MKMENIYKPGDTVYHWKYGKGKIISLTWSNVTLKKVMVDFEKEKEITKFKHQNWDSLSFTPYNLVNGGFSQEKPKKHKK